MRLQRKAQGGEALQVESSDGWPVRFVWRGRRYRVASIEAIWCVEGRWWRDALRRGLRRRYYRLLAWPETNGTRRGGRHLPLCLEIYRQGRQWRVWRLAD